MEEFNIEYQKERGVSPSFRTVMRALDLGSTATVRRYVERLEQDGAISRTDSGAIALSNGLNPATA